MQRPDTLAERVDPGHVVTVYGVAQDQYLLVGHVQGDMPQRVPGCMKRLQDSLADVHFLAVGERMGHFIRLDGLVEPLGATNLPVPAVDEVRVLAVSGDGNAVAML